MSAIGLAEMRAAAKPGECICCGDPTRPLSTSKDSVRHRKDQSRTHRDTCGDAECVTAYMRYWRRDQRRMLKELDARLKALRSAREGAQLPRHATNAVRPTDGAPNAADGQGEAYNG